MAWNEPPRLIGLVPAENTMTSAPCSAAATAQHRPAAPEPTTTISWVLVSAIWSSATGSGGTMNDQVPFSRVSRVMMVPEVDAGAASASVSAGAASSARALTAPPATAAATPAPARKFLRLMSLLMVGLHFRTARRGAAAPWVSGDAPLHRLWQPL